MVSRNMATIWSLELAEVMASSFCGSAPMPGPLPGPPSRDARDGPGGAPSQSRSHTLWRMTGLLQDYIDQPGCHGPVSDIGDPYKGGNAAPMRAAARPTLAIPNLRSKPPQPGIPHGGHSLTPQARTHVEDTSHGSRSRHAHDHARDAEQGAGGHAGLLGHQDHGDDRRRDRRRLPGRPRRPRHGRHRRDHGRAAARRPRRAAAGTAATCPGSTG